MVRLKKGAAGNKKERSDGMVFSDNHTTQVSVFTGTEYDQRDYYRAPPPPPQPPPPPPARRA